MADFVSLFAWPGFGERVATRTGHREGVELARSCQSHCLAVVFGGPPACLHTGNLLRSLYYAAHWFVGMCSLRITHTDTKHAHIHTPSTHTHTHTNTLRVCPRTTPHRTAPQHQRREMYTDTDTIIVAVTVSHTHTHRHTDTQTHRHTDTQTHRHTDTQTHRHTDTQAHRHTGTQTHRHTDRHTDTQTHRHTETHTHTHNARARAHDHAHAHRHDFSGVFMRVTLLRKEHIYMPTMPPEGARWHKDYAAMGPQSRDVPWPCERLGLMKTRSVQVGICAAALLICCMTPGLGLAWLLRGDRDAFLLFALFKDAGSS